jgi:hypothetical protein
MSEDSYRTEEQIWRTKSKTSGYFLKRQFERPDLNEFYKNMKPEICKKYKQLTKNLFHSVCDKLKKKCFESQNKMSDIFDEEANAHRAHCQYIMKLYQMISSQTIEDPILQKLKVSFKSFYLHFISFFLFIFFTFYRKRTRKQNEPSKNPRKNNMI